MNKATGGLLPYPSKCAVCGSSYRDCVDLGIDFNSEYIPIDRLGAVLLCTECFNEAAQVMGYAPVETHVTFVDSDELTQFRIAVEGLKEHVDGLATVLNDITIVDSDSDLSDNRSDRSIDFVRNDSESDEIPGEFDPKLPYDEGADAADYGQGTSNKVIDSSGGQVDSAAGGEGSDELSSGTSNDTGGFDSLEQFIESGRIGKSEPYNDAEKVESGFGIGLGSGHGNSSDDSGKQRESEFSFNPFV